MDQLLAQQQLNEELNKAVALFKQRGKEYAECERNYRVALAKEVTRLRVEGIPVTIINDLSRGNDLVADLKFKRDCAESAYKSVVEAIQVKKLQLRILRSEIEEDRRGC